MQDHRAESEGPRSPSRRRFLRTAPVVAGAGASLLAGPGRALASPTRALRDGAGSAKNLIFMVSDGMSFGTLTLADMYSRRVLGRPSHWMSLMMRPGARRGLSHTSSADSLVTDSSAAASAWGIGVKVNNHAVNLTPDGEMPPPLLVRARAAGLRTGLVTTTRVTHATPAGFIANIPDRDLEKEIAKQVMDRRVDVVLGGGFKYFKPESLTVPDLTVVRTREELRAAATALNRRARLLGLFDDEHVPMELDRLAAGAASTTPTLAEMTRSALDVLSARAEGDGTVRFLMQVEGGRVDHAAHTNDAGSLLREQLTFDEAVAVAAAFTQSRDDTLLILTSDHGNANPGLTLYGKAGNLGFETLAKATRSFEWLVAELAKLPTEARIAGVADLVEATAGVKLKTSQAETLKRALQKQTLDPFDPSNEFTSVVGSVLANHNGVSFVSPNHTSDMVEVTAYGPGSEALPPVLDNTDLHTLAVSVLALPKI